MQEPDMGGWWEEMKGQNAGFVILSLVVVVLIFGLLIFNPIVVIGPGERGVMFDSFTGVQPGVLGEGLHWKVPIIQHIQTFNIKILREDAQAEAASKERYLALSMPAIMVEENLRQFFRMIEESENVPGNEQPD
jgi:regulator of protease activity HflC (stomatin/prohibitin superfamily)